MLDLESFADTDGSNISSEGFWHQHLLSPIHKLDDRQHSPRPPAACTHAHVTAHTHMLLVLATALHDCVEALLYNFTPAES